MASEGVDYKREGFFDADELAEREEIVKRASEKFKVPEEKIDVRWRHRW